jgi:hypothetical protein
MIFIRLDADSIGDKIELALLNGDISLANKIHLSVQKGIRLLKKTVQENPNFTILMIGCDDILFCSESDSLILYELEKLKSLFHKKTKSTLSIGVSNSLQGAILNLRKAKLLGKNQILID